MYYSSNYSQYSGYSEEIYDGYEKTSRYLSMQDGTKLAIDIYRPTKDGVLHEERLPVIWTATQYRRAYVKEDGSYSNLDESSPLWYFPNISKILRHGYVIAALDVRGSGASYGYHGLQNTMKECYDLYEVNEWLAAQPWCSGVTGMFGLSALGKAQIMCAMMAPPSLKCIMPNVFAMENPAMMTNGIVNIGWMSHADEGVWKNSVVDPAPPVDEDPDGIMRAEAIEMHKLNPRSETERREAHYFDDYLPFWDTKVYMEAYYPNYIYNINNSQIACYILGGWKDFYAHDVFFWYKTLKTPKKISVGPWNHTDSCTSQEPFNFVTEHLRWYDYWLKGIDNGIMSEPPVLLYNNGEEAWKEYSDFPLPEQKVVPYYLQGRISHSIDSVVDGSMGTRPPMDAVGDSDYPVDYSITRTGYENRFFYTVKGSTDFTEFDRKSMTFTTPPMSRDMNFIGFPVVNLWISADAPDIDVYFYLQEVDEEGKSANITEQKIRASFRGLTRPPFDNMGLPYHRLMHRDQKELKVGEITKLEVALFPMSNTIKQGHSLRLTINCADRGHWDTPVLKPAPTLTVYHNTEYPSHISLPVIPS